MAAYLQILHASTLYKFNADERARVHFGEKSTFRNVAFSNAQSGRTDRERAGLPLRPRRPSGHSREKEEVREGTAQEEAVAWAEQFPRGGGLSGAC